MTTVTSDGDWNGQKRRSAEDELSGERGLLLSVLVNTSTLTVPGAGTGKVNEGGRSNAGTSQKMTPKQVKCYNQSVPEYRKNNLPLAMKAYPFLAALALVAFVAALGTLYTRTVEARELSAAVIDMEMRLNAAQLDAKELRGQNEQLTAAATEQKRFVTELEVKWQVESDEMKKKIRDLEGCETEKNELKTRLGTEEEELNKVKGQLESDRQNLEREINTLKTQLEALREGKAQRGLKHREALKLCGLPEQQEEPKKEEEKQKPSQ
ncbi:hypothetical protein HHUSO_G29713 [Huso huso]|uniref:Uncharacterized protein n=1 Tax=Huso huso TaxID=61971 RepID=A0ABR0YFC9_HUSHU